MYFHEHLFVILYIRVLSRIVMSRVKTVKRGRSDIHVVYKWEKLHCLQAMSCLNIDMNGVIARRRH